MSILRNVFIQLKLDIFEELSTRIRESNTKESRLLRRLYNLSNITDAETENDIRYYPFFRKIWNKKHQRDVQNTINYFIEK